ncbi:hypothetical protein [Geomicrobium sediminis]|uniref:rRNA maturation endonuclease Nob1 n=1 Tax=Geomicrobium sediminis TaxID=1347788 RepID=A0ABS2PEL3_9BACL|nr:hypothetical protein [Geomicrobium sediminis]MBM7633858.1 rRNA maturation endonuclease Nob1 [Geomicrobium sediminis]
MEDDWVNDAEHHCRYCNIDFKVYVLGDQPEVHFCPTCGTTQFD